LFQGRFKAIVVDRDAYLLSLCRYVERNPVAAGIVGSAAYWPWSSYAAQATVAPDWLDVASLHGMLLQREPRSAADRRRAGVLYAALVDDASVRAPWEGGLRGQIFLGNAEFVAGLIAQASPSVLRSPEVPRAQRRKPAALAHFLGASTGRDEALCAAYTEGGLTMSQIALQSGLSVSRISRIVSALEAASDGLGAKGKT
jgi:hypothetical protein